MRITALLFLCFFVVPSTAQENWQKHVIPGAVCGDGSPYTIFVLDNNSKHINFKFNGGNACWDYETCFGKKPLANMQTVESQNPDNFFSFNEASPVASYDRVVFSYCTGDVYVGNHTAEYIHKEKSGFALHYGRDNILKSLAYLENNGFSFSKYEEVSVYGNSAGALGALYNVSVIAPYFHLLTHKSLLLDGPGLHFGKKFWQKFPPGQIEDFRHTFATYGLILDLTEGNLSPLIPALCNKMSDWHIGILQGSKDLTMSWGFGEISPWDQEKLMYSEQGIWGFTKESHDNCVAFVPSVYQHTFLGRKKSAKQKAKNAKKEKLTATEFAVGILEQSEFENYK